MIRKFDIHVEDDCPWRQRIVKDKETFPFAVYERLILNTVG